MLYIQNMLKDILQDVDIPDEVCPLGVKEFLFKDNAIIDDTEDDSSAESLLLTKLNDIINNIQVSETNYKVDSINSFEDEDCEEYNVAKETSVFGESSDEGLTNSALGTSTMDVEETSNNIDATVFLIEIKRLGINGREFLQLLGNSRITNEAYEAIEFNPQLTYDELKTILQDSELNSFDFEKILLSAVELVKKRKTSRFKALEALANIETKNANISKVLDGVSDVKNEEPAKEIILTDIEKEMLLYETAKVPQEEPKETEISSAEEDLILFDTTKLETNDLEETEPKDVEIPVYQYDETLQADEEAISKLDENPIVQDMPLVTETLTTDGMFEEQSMLNEVTAENPAIDEIEQTMEAENDEADIVNAMLAEAVEVETAEMAEKSSVNNETETVNMANVTSVNSETEIVDMAEVTSANDETETVDMAKETSTNNETETVDMAKETSVNYETETVGMAEVTSVNNETETVDMTEVTSVNNETETVDMAKETSVNYETETVGMAKEASVNNETETVGMAEEANAKIVTEAVENTLAEESDIVHDEEESGTIDDELYEEYVPASSQTGTKVTSTTIFQQQNENVTPQSSENIFFSATKSVKSKHVADEAMPQTSDYLDRLQEVEEDEKPSSELLQKEEMLFPKDFGDASEYAVHFGVDFEKQDIHTNTGKIVAMLVLAVLLIAGSFAIRYMKTGTIFVQHVAAPSAIQNVEVTTDEAFLAAMNDMIASELTFTKNKSTHYTLPIKKTKTSLLTNICSDGKYIFYSFNDKLYIIETKSEQMALIKTIDLPNVKGIATYGNYLVAIIGKSSNIVSSNEKKQRECTEIDIYSTTDFDAEPQRYFQSGTYCDVILGNNFVHLITNENIKYSKNDTAEAVMPVYGINSVNTLKAERIFIPEKNCYSTCTFIGGISFTSQGAEQNDAAIAVMGGDKMQYLRDSDTLYIVKNQENKIYVVSYTIDGSRLIFDAKKTLDGNLLDGVGVNKQGELLSIVSKIDDSYTLYLLNDSLKVTSKVENIATNETILDVAVKDEKAYLLAEKSMYGIDIAIEPPFIDKIAVKMETKQLLPYEDNYLTIEPSADKNNKRKGIKLTKIDTDGKVLNEIVVKATDKNGKDWSAYISSEAEKDITYISTDGKNIIIPVQYFDGISNVESFVVINETFKQLNDITLYDKKSLDHKAITIDNIVYTFWGDCAISSIIEENAKVSSMLNLK